MNCVAWVLVSGAGCDIAVSAALGAEHKAVAVRALEDGAGGRRPRMSDTLCGYLSDMSFP